MGWRNGVEEAGYVTLMQFRALESAAKGVVTPGCSRSAHYQRLRRAAIAAGVYRPRGNAHSSRRTRSLNERQTQAA